MEKRPVPSGHGSSAGRDASWLKVLAGAQVSNVQAAKLGKAPWILVAAAVLFACLLTSFPAVNDLFTTAFDASNPANYPGLQAVFMTIKSKGWSLQVKDRRLRTGSGVPSEYQAGKWKLVFEPAGGTLLPLEGTQNRETKAPGKTAFFGTTAFAVEDTETGKRMIGSWEKMEGFDSRNLAEITPAKTAEMFLFQTATGRLMQSSVLVTLLMTVQVVFLIVMLGFLLSLSGVKAFDATANPGRTVGFVPSLKTAAGTAIGPALLVAVAFFAFPRWASMSWMAFTLLYGFRTVLVYMDRFKNKPRK